MKEIRYTQLTFSTREDDGAKMIIEGQPVIYEQTTDIGGGDFERIERHAAKTAVDQGGQLLLWGHDPAQPIASQSSGTLEVREAPDGVHIRADVSKTSWGRNAFEAIKNGVIDSMSFGFAVGEIGWMRENGKAVRIIRSIEKIYEYSIVAFPAYGGTLVEARSVLRTETPGPSTDGSLEPAGNHLWDDAFARRMLNRQKRNKKEGNNI